jgi:DNA-binding protein H-NS
MNKTASWPLILIALALAGAGVSYHFTLESRFASIEQKLDQNSAALLQYQVSQETILSSKAAALDNLSKELDTLQTSLKPLGNATKEQTESLTEIHKQIASLQASQQSQQDAQKKLADYAAQLDKVKHDLQAVQSAPAPVSTPTAAPASAEAPATAPHPSSASVPPALPPMADSALDLRPAQITVAAYPSVRAVPVALPVDISTAGNP